MQDFAFDIAFRTIERHPMMAVQAVRQIMEVGIFRTGWGGRRIGLRRVGPRTPERDYLWSFGNRYFVEDDHA